MKQLKFILLCSLIFLMENMNAQDLISKIINDQDFDISKIYEFENSDLNKRNNSVGEVAKPALFSFKNISKEYNKSAVRQYKVHINIDENVASDIENSNYDQLLINLPITNKKSIELVLHESNLLSDNFEVVTNLGRKISVPGVYYQGTIRQYPSSIVTMNIVDNKVSLHIYDEDGYYDLQRDDSSTTEYKFMKNNESDTNDMLSCGVDHSKQKPIEVENLSKNVNNLPEGCIYINVYIDFSLYSVFNGDIEKITTHTFNIYSDVFAILGKDGFSLQIARLFIWETPDPYHLLNQFEKIIQLEQDISFNNELGFLHTGFPTGPGGVASGIGQGQWAVSRFFGVPNFSFGVRITAHELGHLFGSGHTNLCIWNGNNTPLDSCGEPFYNCEPVDVMEGGIMSTCNDRTSVFHPQVIERMQQIMIQNRLAYFKTCGGDCPSFIHITQNYLNGEENYYGANDRIHATNTIEAGARVGYFAGGHIELRPGFFADYKSFALVDISGCSQPSNIYSETQAIIIGSQKNLNDGLNVSKRINEEIQINVYPNPMDNRFEVNFELETTSDVQLHVFNIEGKLVTTFISTELKAGNHIYELDSSGIESGLYVIQLQTNNFSSSKKITKI